MGEKFELEMLLSAQSSVTSKTEVMACFLHPARDLHVTPETALLKMPARGLRLFEIQPF